MDNQLPGLRAKHKVVFLGDPAVGKTSIINQFMYGTFDTKHNATIGIDYLSKIVNTGSKSIRLQIWDTAGQERFRALIPSYIRDASVVVIAYDVCDKQTFESLERWVNSVRDVQGDSVIIMLVGNKVDLEARCVTDEQAQEAAEKWNLAYHATSAKSGENVNALFTAIADRLPDYRDTPLSPGSHPSTVKIERNASNQAAQERQSGCSC